MVSPVYTYCVWPGKLERTMITLPRPRRESHDVGSVGCLRQVKSAISVARSVMERTGHTLLVGELGQSLVHSVGGRARSVTSTLC